MVDTNCRVTALPRWWNINTRGRCSACQGRQDFTLFAGSCHQLAALFPKPRADQTRYHGAFASIVFFIQYSLLRFGSYKFIPVIE